MALANIDHLPFIRHAQRETNIYWIKTILGVSLDACIELYRLIEEEVQSYSEITSFSYPMIWEPCWQHAQNMMLKGEWSLEDWKKYVLDFVSLKLLLETTFGYFPVDLLLSEIEEIEF